eukprot:491537_1
MYEVIGVISTIGINFIIITFYRSIDVNSFLYNILWNVAIFTQPLSLYAGFYCLLWRCWHFYYDAMLNIHYESEWKTIIDARLNAEKCKNWFLKHKLTFGSQAYIGKLALLLYILSCIISISVWFLHGIIGYTIASLIDFLVFLGPYISFFYLYRKTPKIGDELHICDEMKWVNLMLIGSLMFYLLIVIIGSFLPTYQNICAIIMCFSSSFWLFMASIFHTKYVLSNVNSWMKNSLKLTSKKHLKLQNLPSRLKSLLDSHTIPDTIPSKLPSVTNESVYNTANVIQLLQNEATFNGFVHHLNSEYSIECLLCYIELSQFVQWLVQHENKLKKLNRKNSVDIMMNEFANCENQNEEVMLVQFKDFVPRSQIIDQDISNKDDINLVIAKQKAYYLYVKYICEGSLYEVNISYFLRARFMNIMDDYDLWINSDTVGNNNVNNNNDIDDIIANVDGVKLVKMFNMVL